MVHNKDKPATSRSRGKNGAALRPKQIPLKDRIRDYIRAHTKRVTHKATGDAFEKIGPGDALERIKLWEILENMLNVLPYRDLRNWYNISREVRDTVIMHSPRLRRTLFIDPDYRSREKVLPLKGYNARFGMPLQSDLQSHERHMYTFSFETINALRQPPDLDILNKFIMQPPQRRMTCYLTHLVKVTTFHRERESYTAIRLSNENGVRLRDLLRGIGDPLVHQPRDSYSYGRVTVTIGVIDPENRLDPPA